MRGRAARQAVHERARSPEILAAIRSLAAGGAKQHAIALELGVSQAHVSRVLHGDVRSKKPSAPPESRLSARELEDLARELGVTRHPSMTVPCSGCGVVCRPVEPLGCFCVRCVAKQREPIPLTQAEVDALPEGTRVRVKWSGGNGPHDYILRRDSFGAYGLTEQQDADPAERYRYIGLDGKLWPVGEHPLTQVWLSSSKAGSDG